MGGGRWGPFVGVSTPLMRQNLFVKSNGTQV